MLLQILTTNDQLVRHHHESFTELNIVQQLGAEYAIVRPIRVLDFGPYCSVLIGPLVEHLILIPVRYLTSSSNDKLIDMCEALRAATCIDVLFVHRSLINLRNL